MTEKPDPTPMIEQPDPCPAHESNQLNCVVCSIIRRAFYESVEELIERRRNNG